VASSILNVSAGRTKKKRRLFKSRYSRKRPAVAQHKAIYHRNENERIFKKMVAGQRKFMDIFDNRDVVPLLQQNNKTKKTKLFLIFWKTLYILKMTVL
jgi:hypothetical protein